MQENKLFLLLTLSFCLIFTLNSASAFMQLTCTEDANSITCQNGFFTGNFIDTDKNITIYNATINASGNPNDLNGFLRLNTTTGFINITDSYLDAMGKTGNTGGAVGSKGNITILNAPLGLFIKNGTLLGNGLASGATTGRGSHGLCYVNVFGNITLDFANFTCYGSNAGTVNGREAGSSNLTIITNQSVILLNRRSFFNANSGKSIAPAGNDAGCFDANFLIQSNTIESRFSNSCEIMLDGCDAGVGIGTPTSGSSFLYLYANYINFSGIINISAGDTTGSSFGNASIIIGSNITARNIFYNSNIFIGRANSANHTEIFGKEFTLYNTNFSTGNQTNERGVSFLNVSSDIGKIGIFNSTIPLLPVSYGGTFGIFRISNSSPYTLNTGSLTFEQRTQADYFSPLLKLTAPANNTIIAKTRNYFMDVLAEFNLVNATVFIYNSSGFVINNGEYANITGLSNSSSVRITLPYNDSFQWNYKVYDSNNLFSYARNNFSFTADVNLPNITINSIDVQANSKTITFNATTIDTNLQSCWYSIFNSTGGIDQTFLNVSYTCNQTVTISVSDFSTYNLTVYANDTIGNDASASQLFTTFINTPSSGSGAGGGSVVNNGNLTWEIQTANGFSSYTLTFKPGTTRRNIVQFVNRGQEEVQLTISCEGQYCANVSFSSINVTLPIGSNLRPQISVITNVPDNLPNGQYNYAIVGTDSQGNRATLGVIVLVGPFGFLGQIISNFGTSKDIFGLPIPYWLIGLIIGVGTFAFLNYTILSRNKFGLAISIFSAIIVGIGSLAFL